MDTRRLVAFLRALKTHNTKPWFDTHRQEYQELRTEFSDVVQQTILLIAKFDPQIKHLTAKEAMYRINRDIRFSNNKQPYKTNFGAGIGAGKKGQVPGYHFHIDADGLVMAAGGMYMLDSRQLAAVRDSIVRRPGRLRAIVQSPQMRRVFGGLHTEDHLTKPPRGFSSDHPDIDLIKLKRYVAWVEWPVSSLSADHWPERIAKSCQTVYPLVDYLRQVLA